VSDVLDSCHAGTLDVGSDPWGRGVRPLTLTAFLTRSP
jgi:hypothetical protein